MGLVKLDEWGMVRLVRETGSMSFYKCSSIDTTNHKWSGYLAIVNPVTGVWDFAKTATPNRPYSDLVPQVGKVYDATCTFMVSGYKTGLPGGYIFYLPLNADPGSKDVTGKDLYRRNGGNISYGHDLLGVTCTTMTGNYTAITGPDISALIPNESAVEFSLSAWLGFENLSDYASFGILTKRADDGSLPYTFCGVETFVNEGVVKYTLMSGKDNTYNGYSEALPGIHHLLVTFANGIAKLYVDGVFAVQENWDYSTPFGSRSSYYPGINLTSGNGKLPYYAAFRVYNRALDDSEITALASEFTPTPAS